MRSTVGAARTKPFIKAPLTTAVQLQAKVNTFQVLDTASSHLFGATSISMPEPTAALNAFRKYALSPKPPTSITALIFRFVEDIWPFTRAIISSSTGLNIWIIASPLRLNLFLCTPCWGLFTSPDTATQNH